MPAGVPRVPVTQQHNTQMQQPAHVSSSHRQHNTQPKQEHQTTTRLSLPCHVLGCTCVCWVSGVCVRREDSGVSGRVCVCVCARAWMRAPVWVCVCCGWHSNLGRLAEVGRHGGQTQQEQRGDDRILKLRTVRIRVSQTLDPQWM